MQFGIGDRIKSPSAVAHRSGAHEPVARPLRIYATDPSLSRFDGCVAIAEVPYEPLGKPDGGRLLRGRLFEVDVASEDGGDSPLAAFGAAPGTADTAGATLDEPSCLMRQGHPASEGDVRFHAQMVYAVANVVHASFRRALGRQIGWNRNDAGPLRLRPLFRDERNAWYASQAGEIRFGYVKTADEGCIFSSLSHDIIAHEVTHAVLDGLRSRFSVPTSADVCGFHEGFADLVALFHHYQYPAALRAALARTGGRIRPRRAEERNAGHDYLDSLARQFGRGPDGRRGMRSAATDAVYQPTLEAHAMGAVLLAAVFDAFECVYERKTAPLRRLAAAEAGGDNLHPVLLDLLAQEASRLARSFLNMVIRAIDYCPPVDLQLGEYLRALVSADADLVPDDPLGYREALIDSFRRRGIRPRDVLSLGEASLRWKPPSQGALRIDRLAFANIRFAGDPDCPLHPTEQAKLAAAIGDKVTQPEHRVDAGLTAVHDQHVIAYPPTIQSVRTLRRPGQDGHVMFETVVEVTQDCDVRAQGDAPAFSFDGGSTLIFSSTGELRLAVGKRIDGDGRLARRQAFLMSAAAKHYWTNDSGSMTPRDDFCFHLHAAHEEHG